MGFCLPTKLADKFIEALKKGKLDPAKLADMSSAERRGYLETLIGKENAPEVNARFESKLLLKNQQLGMINWARQVAGLKDAVRHDLISTIQKMDTILTPATEQRFLEDLAAKKLGTEVTFEEAKKVSELSSDVSRLHEAVTPASLRGSPERMSWGHAQLDLHDYVEGLKGIDKRIVSNVANLPKTIMSTGDFSAALRQGFGMISRPQWLTAFGKMFKYAASEKSYRDLQAEIVSDPNYEIMKKSGLRVSVLADKLSSREEQFMSTLVQRIPGIRHSERAYVGFLNKLRTDVFDALLKSADMNGEDTRPGSQPTKDIANVVNDFTGSGNIGKGDKYANIVPTLNATFFAPRKISATLNKLNPQRYLDPSISPTARRAALRNLIGQVAATALILSMTKLAGGKVETDPTSADFGKAVWNKTHYDFTGGDATYAVLLARLIENKTKSTTTGKTTALGKGYKPTTRADLLVKFGRNKLSPLSSLVADWLYGSDAIGNPFNLPHAVISRIVPLTAQDVQQVIQSDPSNTLGGTTASLFGVGVQVY